VYAVASGFVQFNDATAVAVLEPSGRTIAYWHIVPVVRPRQYVVRHQLVGYIARGKRHVHLSERNDGGYVNPLRPEGIGPYRDDVGPTIAELGFAPSRAGTVDVVVSAFDVPPRVSREWPLLPVTPALIRWRIVKDGHTFVPWRIAADFQTTLPPTGFSSIYAPRTQQNRYGEPGRYCFYIRKTWQIEKLASRGYALEVVAEDTRGERRRRDVAAARRVSESRLCPSERGVGGAPPHGGDAREKSARPLAPDAEGPSSNRGGG